MIDVEAECRAAYGSSGNGTVAICLRREQPFYDLAKLAWPQVPESERARCRKTADGNGLGRHTFYSILGRCLSGSLEREQLRRDAVNPPAFRY